MYYSIWKARVLFSTSAIRKSTFCKFVTIFYIHRYTKHYSCLYFTSCHKIDEIHCGNIVKNSVLDPDPTPGLIWIQWCQKIQIIFSLEGWESFLIAWKSFMEIFEEIFDIFKFKNWISGHQTWALIRIHQEACSGSRFDCKTDKKNVLVMNK
jgi:hypothetical protein